MANNIGIPLTPRLCEALRDKRLEMNLTQSELASKVGLNRRESVAVIESGAGNPTLKTLNKMARVLKIKVVPLQPADLGQ